MADPGPRQVVDDRQHPLRGQHVHGLQAGLDTELAIGVEGILHARLLDDEVVVHQVAGDIERLAARRDHEAGMPHRVAGRVHRLYARHDLLAVAVEEDALAVRQQVLLGSEGGAFARRAQASIVGPIFEVGFRDEDLGVRKILAAVLRQDPADMVDVTMRRNDEVDVLGIDAGSFEVLGEAPHVLAALDRAHAGLEQRKLVAGVDDERVLVEHDIVGRQKMIGHHAAELLGARPDERFRRCADRHRPVGYDRRLDAADLEAIECRCLRVQHRRLGMARCNTGEPDGRRGGSAREQVPTRYKRISHIVSSLIVLL